MSFEWTPGLAGRMRNDAQARLEQSVAATLGLIASTRAERETPTVHAARQQLVANYGATRLRRRLEQDA